MTPDEKIAIQYIIEFIKESDRKEHYGWVVSEVTEVFWKYRTNAPDGDCMDQARGAIRATAHE